MIYGSVCSGIEAATVAWHPLGWKPAFFSEIEAFPRAVLAHHYPATPLHGDFTTIGADDYGPIDLLVGGTPCQSFSIAGLRGGLDDDRGNLALEFLRLAQRKRPKWLVWENVPGVLSSNGGWDFGAILGGMVECGYGFAYRVLDAQFFGVPQRRRRVFVVGHIGDWRPAAAVLFERHSLSGHPAPRREKGEGSSCRSSSRTDRSLFQDSEFGVGEYDNAGSLRAGRIPEHQMVLKCWPAEVAPTLTAAFGSKLGLEDQHIRGGGDCLSVAQCLTTGTGRRYDAETETLITMHGGGFDVTAFAHQQGGSIDLHMSNDCALTIQRSQTQAVNYATAVRRLTPRECERLQGFPDDYTAIPWRGKTADQCPDGPRYKALGNSMAVPVMRWIGERIALVDAINLTNSREMAA